jgi:hypothetical protein
MAWLLAMPQDKRGRETMEEIMGGAQAEEPSVLQER